MSIDEALEPTEAPSIRQRRKWPRILLVGGFVLLVLIVLRETGHLNLGLHTSLANSQIKSFASASRRYSDKASEIDVSQVNFTTEISSKVENSVAATATKALRQLQIPGSGSQGQLIVEIQQADLTGTYWLPLFKRAGCDFAANYTLNSTEGDSSIKIEGKVEGRLDLTVMGICSSFAVRQIFGQQLASEVEKKIRAQLTPSKPATKKVSNVKLRYGLTGHCPLLIPV